MELKMENIIEKLEYSFIRTESDGKFTLFINTPMDIIDKDLEMLLMPDRKLLIRMLGKDYITDELPIDLFFHLKDKHTTSIFTDKDGTPIFSYEFPPFVKSIN